MAKCTPEYNDETRRLMAHAADLRRVAKGAETGDFSVAAKAKANEVIDAGETDPLKVVDAVHQFLNEHVPLAKDEVAAMIAEPKARTRSEAVQRRAEVIAQLRDLEKTQKGLDAAEAERKAKSEGQSKARINAQIADLSRQIESGVNTAKEKGQPINTPEIAELRRQRDALRQERDNQEPSPPPTKPADLTKSQLKQTNPARAREEAQIEQLQKDIEKLNDKIAKGDTSKPGKVQGPDSAKVTRLKAERAAKQRELDNLRPSPEPTRPVDPSIAKNKAAQARAKARIAELTRQLETNDFTPAKKAKSPFVRDPETERLTTERNQLQRQVDKTIRMLELKNRGPFEKAWAMFMDVFRGVILSGSATLAKLTGAAALRIGATPLEGLIGQGLKHLPYLKSRIYAHTAYEGGSFRDFVEGEKAAITHTLNSDAFKEIWSKLKGDSNLKDLVGGESYPDARENWGKFMGTILALPARIHGVLKTPAELNDFHRALTRYSQAERRAMEAKGMSPAEVEAHMRDQSTVAVLQVRAYLKSREAILLQDNKANDIINGWIGQLKRAGSIGKTVAGAIEYELPIKKVATNIFSEATSYMAGALKTKMKISEVNKDVREGRRASATLTPDEADQLARYLQKQTVGVALGIIGWMGANALGGMYHRGQKTPQGQPQFGEIKFGEDVTLGRQWTHTPALETLMVAADAHRAYDAAGGGMKGATAAVYKSVADVLSDLPFMRNLKDIPEALESEGRAKAFAGNVAASLIPPDVRKYAQEHDTKTLPDGRVVHVDRKATEIPDYVKRNLPGYRETLKEKGTRP